MENKKIIELLGTKKEFLIENNLECIGMLKKVYLTLKHEIEEIFSKLEAREKKMIETYRSFIDTALNLSMDSTLSCEQREKWYTKAEEIANKLNCLKEKQNKRDEKLLIEKEKTKRGVIYSIVAMTTITLTQVVKKIINNNQNK